MKKYIIILVILTINCDLNAQDFINYRRIFNEILKTAKDISAFETFIDTTQAYYYDFSIKLNKLNRKSENKNNKFCKDYWENCRKKMSIDTALLFKITDMQFVDQAAREDDISNREMFIIDSLNYIELKKIILERGKIPGVIELDTYGLMCIETLLRHVGDTVFFNFLYPYMIKAAKNGDFVPELIASDVDYHWFACQFIPKDSTKYFSYQLYGTMHFRLERTNGKISGTTRLDKSIQIKIPVKDWEETERLRYELGMQSLKEELEKNPNLIYDVELFKEKFPEFQY